MLRYIYDRINVHPDLCGGKSPEDVLEEYEFLELVDIKACQQFAMKMTLEALSHRVYLSEAA